MKINNDHMYHGAALTQIAEHPAFTAINVFRTRQGASRSGFVINSNIGVYLKYASEPKLPFNEYVFQFHTEHLFELRKIAKNHRYVYLGLICVQGRQICCLPLEMLEKLIDRRRKKKGSEEDQYTILVTMPKGGYFRVYISDPGKKKTFLGEQYKIARSDFPDKLFD